MDPITNRSTHLVSSLNLKPPRTASSYSYPLRHCIRQSVLCTVNPDYGEKKKSNERKISRSTHIEWIIYLRLCQKAYEDLNMFHGDFAWNPLLGYIMRASYELAESNRNGTPLFDEYEYLSMIACGKANQRSTGIYSLKKDIWWDLKRTRKIVVTPNNSIQDTVKESYYTDKAAKKKSLRNSRKKPWIAPPILVKDHEAKAKLRYRNEVTTLLMWLEKEDIIALMKHFIIQKDNYLLVEYVMTGEMKKAQAILDAAVF